MQHRTPALVLAVAFVAAGCATAARVPVRGEVAGSPVDTVADSHEARYLVEHYLRGEVADPVLHARIDAVAGRYATAPPGRRALAELARTFSPDFAALFLASTLYAHPDNRRLQDGYRAAMASASPVPADVDRSDVSVLFVPGWFYESSPENGGDFARPRELLHAAGVSNTLVRTHENGSVDVNATIVANAIRAASRRGGRYVVVSASKSGPEVALALGSILHADEARPVVGWVNIGGVVGGSPLADRALSLPARCIVGMVLQWNGFECDGLVSLATDVRRRELDALRFPPHVRIVNYVPVPLAADVTERARDRYEDLVAHGPNDGLVLLSDQLVPGGATVLELGADHFFKLPDMDRRTLALLGTMLDYTDAPPAAPRYAGR